MLNGSMVSGLLLVLMVLPLGAAIVASETMTLTLPEGDAKAGRAAFVALSCTSCHRVAGEEGLPEPVSATPGPTLGSYQGRQTPGRLAMSIFAPSHEITANVRGQDKDDLSPMPNFTETMTVRQFVNLIAFIRSLAAEG